MPTGEAKIDRGKRDLLDVLGENVYKQAGKWNGF